PDDAFCGDCGTPLTAEAPAVVRAEPSAERRLVSVLFADLVGFTSLSETRDAEEVRELLSRYFDICRRIIGVYGGTVEKFIEDAGSFELKGKEGLTPLWRALRIVSGLRGSLKSHGLEAPFVGRDRELRTIKDLFHTCADEGKARLLSVTGIAGIGKSRLGWEFYKYF